MDTSETTPLPEQPSLPQVLEALFYASPEPRSAKGLAKIVREVAAAESAYQHLAATTEQKVLQAIEAMQRALVAAACGVQLLERAQGWKLYTHPLCAPFVRALHPAPKPARLSAPALETLAIIAYRQPLTKADVEVVRGVSIDGVLQTLLDRELVHVAGRAQTPGKPLLYATTDYFLEHFGLRSLEELPNAMELRQVELPQSDTQEGEVENQLVLSALPEKSPESEDESPGGEEKQ